MKKTLSLILALVLALAAFPTSIGFATADDVIEIEFYTGRSFEGDAESELEKDNFVEQYLRENLGVDIEYVYTEDMAANLPKRLMSGDIPEIMNIPNRNFLKEFADEG